MKKILILFTLSLFYISCTSSLPRASEDINSVLYKIHVKNDEMSEITWYHHQSEPRFVDNNRSYMYIGQKKSKLWLRLVFNFTAQDWLFIKGYILKSGENKIEIPIDYNDVNRKAMTSGMIYEKGDIEVSKKIEEFFQKISENDPLIVRYVGDDYHQDKQMGKNDLIAIKEIIMAYEILKKQ